MNKTITLLSGSPMSELVHSLREQYPCEKTPFGECVIIPSRVFRNEWQKQLETEGYKVFSQSWNGESSFFVRLEKKADSKFRKHWTPAETNQLKELVSMGLRPSEIASKLGRTATAVKGKIQRMNLNSHVQPTSRLESTTNIGEDVVKEYLACVSELYPRYPHVCANLLKEASQKILGGKG